MDGMLSVNVPLNTSLRLDMDKEGKDIDQKVSIEEMALEGSGWK